MWSRRQRDERNVKKSQEMRVTVCNTDRSRRVTVIQRRGKEENAINVG